MPSFVAGRGARYPDCLTRKHRGGEKHGPVVFAAVHAMADPDPVGRTEGLQSDRTTLASACHPVHVRPPRSCLQELIS